MLRQAAVATEDKNHILSSNNWTEVLNKKQIKSLSGVRVIVDDWKIYLMTRRHKPSEFMSGPVLAYDITLLFLKIILMNTNVSDFIFVPRTQMDLELFKQSNTDAISI